MSGSNTKYEHLEVASAENPIPSATATPIAQVIAPATLPEGYSFEAEIGGKVVSVVVPPGGVEEGQTFTAPLNEDTRARPNSIPVGAWRDGICDFCKFGCCHPLLCLGWWCPLVALAQVMRRMQLNWFGQDTGPNASAATFKTVLGIVILYHVLNQTFGMLMLGFLPVTDANGNPPASLPMGYVVLSTLRYLLHVSFFIYSLVCMIRVRSYIRSKYAIPEKQCAGCEDCCCSFWCACCSVTQMARHTADYDTYRAACCTETGLPPTVAAIV